MVVVWCIKWGRIHGHVLLLERQKAKAWLQALWTDRRKDRRTLTFSRFVATRNIWGGATCFCHCASCKASTSVLFIRYIFLSLDRRWKRTPTKWDRLFWAQSLSYCGSIVTLTIAYFHFSIYTIKIISLNNCWMNEWSASMFIKDQ